MCCITLKTIFAVKVLLIRHLSDYYLPMNRHFTKYLHYAPLILPSGTYDSQLISARWLASLYITTTYVMSPKARIL